MDPPQTKLEFSDGIAIITLNRPSRLNAYTEKMATELVAHFDEINKNDLVRCAIVTGSGSTFCAGADLLSLPPELGGTGKALSHRDSGGQLSLSILRCRKPVIAAINGNAVGIGITMTLAMDIRVVAQNAKIGFVFARRGIVPEACSSFLLPRIVGPSKANELVFTGRVFQASEEPTLFSHIVPSEKVLKKAIEIAKEIIKSAPSSVALSKALMIQGLQSHSLVESHLNESKCLSWCFTESPDAKEGVLSFLQKRNPNWSVSPWNGLPDFYPQIGITENPQAKL